MTEKMGGFDPDSQPADHEIEVNPEKKEVSREVSPQEYVEALKRVLTGPKREQCLDRMRDLLRKLNEIDEPRKSKIKISLAGTLRSLRESSQGLEDYYDSVIGVLDQAVEILDKA